MAVELEELRIVAERSAQRSRCAVRRLAADDRGVTRALGDGDRRLGVGLGTDLLRLLGADRADCAACASAWVRMAPKTEARFCLGGTRRRRIRTSDDAMPYFSRTSAFTWSRICRISSIRWTESSEDSGRPARTSRRVDWIDVCNWLSARCVVCSA